ncbi:MAG: DUF2304 family protein [Thermoleophilia bacterium]|nr:DUF2304 family protein [Thermoleophilia bacterium]
MIVVALACVALAGVLVALVGRRAIEERHALWWMAVAVACGVVIAAPSRGALARAADVSPAVVVLGVVAAGLGVLLLAAYATLARLSGQTRALAQRLAMHEERHPPEVPGG